MLYFLIITLLSGKFSKVKKIALTSGHLFQLRRLLLNKSEM